MELASGATRQKTARLPLCENRVQDAHKTKDEEGQESVFELSSSVSIHRSPPPR